MVLGFSFKEMGLGFRGWVVLGIGLLWLRVTWAMGFRVFRCFGVEGEAQDQKCMSIH